MILVATDFSTDAGHALAYGVGLADRLGTDIGLLHVFEPPIFSQPGPVAGPWTPWEVDQWLPTIENETHRQLEALAATVSTSHGAAHAFFRKGAASLNVPRAADELSAELLVLGSHGRTGLAHAFLGSVAESAVRAAHCPVLTVRSGHRAPDPRLATIMVPVDFSSGSSAALAYAVQFAKRVPSQLVVVHVVETWSYAVTESAQWVNVAERLTQLAEAMLETMVAEARAQDVFATKMVSQGTPYHELTEIAARVRADLIVMGTHGRQGLRRMLAGSVAERVVRLAPCPVVTVREGGAEHRSVQMG